MATKTRTVGVIMDPIGAITPKKDSSLAMLLEAARREWDIVYFEQADLSLRAGEAEGNGQRLTVRDDQESWYELGEPVDVNLGDLDVVLMRKDPPFDMEYIYTTYILDRAALKGALIVNAPEALRNINEKAYTAWFPELTPLTLITRSMEHMRSFLADNGRTVVKPLHGMGGKSIFVLEHGDNNANVVFETLTDYGSEFAMTQTFIPEISDGDKRILLIDGEPGGRLLLGYWKDEVRIIDIARVVHIARRVDAPVACDSTWGTPLTSRSGRVQSMPRRPLGAT